MSQNNRLIERHDANYGAYWQSYDFADNTERQNMFDHPLGPAAGGSIRSQHDGGEIIFRLPNGLQGYMLVNGKGSRIDGRRSRSSAIPSGPIATVINGLSCMTCHVEGIIPKADQVRGSRREKRRLCSAPRHRKGQGGLSDRGRLQGAARDDGERFRKAVEATGAKIGATKPVAAWPTASTRNWT